MKRSVFIFLMFSLMVMPSYHTIAQKDHPSNTEEETSNSALKRWVEGPVRYLITAKEEKAFKKLMADNQRAYFIYRFWYKRDATPGTVRNEFREIFWDRVLTANTMFNETSKPGWKTDRGKIFILLGPPNIIESDTHPDVPFPPPLVGSEGGDALYSDYSGNTTGRRFPGSTDINQMRLDTGFRGIERWIYFQAKSRNIPPHMIVAFYRSGSGEYVLSDNPRHYTQLFPGLEARPDSSAFFNLPRETAAAGNLRGDIQFSKSVDYTPLFSFENSIAFKLDLAAAVEPPTVEELIEEAVTASQFFNTMQAAFRTHLFMDARHEPYVILQGIVPRKEILMEGEKEPALVSLFGRVEKKDDRNVYYSFASDATVPGNILEEDDALILLARVAIPPGSYHARIGILNLPYGTAGNFEMEIDVPDMSLERPALSSLVLTSSMRYGKDSGGEFPGQIFIRPKASSEFSLEEDFGVYFIVYNLSRNPDNSLPDFTLTYRVYKKEGEQYRAIGTPIIKSHLDHEVQGWTFPLKKWPNGDFLFEVEVADNLSGDFAAKNVPFSVK